MNARQSQGSSAQSQSVPEKWGDKILEVLNLSDQKKERADLAMTVMEETPPEPVLDRARKLKEEVDKGEKPRDWSWMPTALKVGVGLGTAYLSWKVFSKLWTKEVDEKEGKKDKEAFFSTAEKAIGLATLGGVAWLVGKEAIPGYFKDKMGLDAKKETVDRFIARLKEKGMKDALAELTLDSDEAYLTRMAETISVERKYILNLRDVSYSTFLEHRKGQISGKFGYATMQIAEMVGFDLSSNIPFTNADDDLREANADAKIQIYIEANSTEEERKKKTIGELLQTIDQREHPETTPELTKKPLISEDPKLLEEKGKNTSNLIKSWGEEPQEGQTPSSVEKKAGDLVDAAAKDGGQLFCYEGVLYLLSGGSIMVLSSCSFFVDTVCDVAEAAATEEKTAGSVVTSFLERGGLTYVGGGMAVGVAIAGLQKAGILNGSGSVIFEALKGAGRGIIAPLNIFKGTAIGAKTVYAGAQWATDEAKLLFFTAKELADPSNKLVYQRARAAWAAEEFLKLSTKPISKKSPVGTWKESNLESNLHCFQKT
ncbi:hypothetical protein IPG41_00885 [Candidatus Peregrinibacteria bacterium]|nr:MAG: hypothetical protein IPG41_00885 [Candidatus Peregrinibacteria bacterium]